MTGRYKLTWLRCAAILLLGLCAGVQAGQQDADDSPQQFHSSDQGTFQVSYTSSLQPLAINRIHDWLLQVQDARGRPVDNAAIEVQGGMPAHDHGLPTRPQVTDLGAGRYRLEGIRFHMMGHWEIRLDIKAGSVSDSVLIPLQL